MGGFLITEIKSCDHRLSDNWSDDFYQLVMKGTHSVIRLSDMKEMVFRPAGPSFIWTVVFSWG